MIVGYARVSTDGQTLAAQQSALRQAGATQVFSEKISGTVTDRKQLAKAIAAIVLVTFCWLLVLIGSRDQLEICSTSSTQFRRLRLALRASLIRGRIPRPHMASS
jgi:Resolvase, N terminal domain